MKRGFSLVELLVAVSIVAILAAIGAVNFQAAQARSKVSRVHADVRTLRTALEAYRSDHRAYPPAAIGGGDVPVAHPLRALTRPVRYLGSLPRDPFGACPFDFNPAMKLAGYDYKDRATTSIGLAAETYGGIWRSLLNRDWMIHSPGPNAVWDVLPYTEYDPTNGTVSRGDIAVFGP